MLPKRVHERRRAVQIPFRRVPQPWALLTDALDWDPASVRAVPATYIQTTRDRVIRPKDQLRMARRVAGVEVVPLAAGHADPVLYPEPLVALLLQDA